MKKQSFIGKKHVMKVSEALKASLAGQSIENFPETIIETIVFIQKKYPTIASVVDKYESSQPNHAPDLQLHLLDETIATVNLFTIRGGAAIQPKNLGAKSFFKKYFHSQGLQAYFNAYLDKIYKKFLKASIALKEPVNEYDSVLFLKRKMRDYYPKFGESLSKYTITDSNDLTLE